MNYTNDSGKLNQYSSKCPFKYVSRNDYDARQQQASWPWGFYTLTLDPTDYRINGQVLEINGPLYSQDLGRGWEKGRYVGKGNFRITCDGRGGISVYPTFDNGQHFMHFNFKTSLYALNKNDDNNSSLWCSNDIIELLNKINSGNHQFRFDKRKVYNGEKL